MVAGSSPVSPVVGSIAQWLEQRTHNSLVVGSSPTGPNKRERRAMMARLFLWACPTQSYRIRAMIDSQPLWDYVPPNPFGFVPLLIVSQKTLDFSAFSRIIKVFPYMGK